MEPDRGAVREPFDCQTPAEPQSSTDGQKDHCGHDDQPHSHETDSQSAGTLAEQYERARSTPSDINEHCETLWRLSSECEHATEFGMRHGVSTVALLAGSLDGRLKTLVSYEAEPTCAIRSVAALAPDVFVFRAGNSLAVEIDETDLLFIDTKHTADQLYGELTRHAERVRRWIVMHDTQIFGEKGEDGGAGLLPALRRFLKERTEWSVVEHHTHNHGLTVISRDPRDKPTLPSTITMAANFAKALAAHVADGREKVERDTYEQRLTVCSLCDQRTGNRCAACGCHLDQKAAWRSSLCPLGKWPA